MTGNALAETSNLITSYFYFFHKIKPVLRRSRLFFSPVQNTLDLDRSGAQRCLRRVPRASFWRRHSRTLRTTSPTSWRCQPTQPRTRSACSTGLTGTGRASPGCCPAWRRWKRSMPGNSLTGRRITITPYSKEFQGIYRRTDLEPDARPTTPFTILEPKKSVAGRTSCCSETSKRRWTSFESLKLRKGRSGN